MPMLPTFEIKDPDLWNRLLVVFDNDPAKYRQWLREQLKMEVHQREIEIYARGRGTELQTLLEKELPKTV